MKSFCGFLSYFNIHKEGYPFVAAFLILSLIMFAASNTVGVLGLVLTICCAAFFRDPVRITPQFENAVISPADGIVVNIEELNNQPDWLGITNKGGVRKISIFLSVFDPHVNRIPISGKVKALNYHKGKFFNASLDKASIHNERQAIVIQTTDEQEIGMVQIAGLIARRIVCYLKQDESVIAGERFGIIRFGSRVDLYIPIDAEIVILKGQRMVAGETVIAYLGKKLGN